MNDVTLIQPVILSGGSGTRLWPLSRELYPKQVLPLASGQSLLQDTVERLDQVNQPGIRVSEPLVVCNEEHRFLVAEQLRALNHPAAQILLEPVGRNTAPALTLAALAAQRENPDALLFALPADHVVRGEAAFAAAVRRGVELADAGHLVTFGVVPTAPHTGYGYIRRGAAVAGENPEPAAYVIAAFVEKPDAATAQEYLDQGKYFWNSGMFLLHAGRWLEELARFRPDILAACRAAFDAGKHDQDFFRPERAAFQACPPDSIDYAVMEKTDAGAVVALAADWCDVGSWAAIWQLLPKDAQHNAVQGDVVTRDTQRSLLMARHRLLATVGVEDLIVVETADAVLVANRERAEDVKALVEQLKRDGREEHLNHRCVHRPWGSYEGVDEGSRFQVKRLTVKPGAALSSQLHHHRAEHWIVVRGTAQVTRGDEIFLLTENQSTYIPLGVKHRLENPGKIPLEMIEVQSGTYLEEDDIVRFEDRYNRQSV